MYKVLIDYGIEGFKFQDEEFMMVSSAVAHAVKVNYGSPFLIVKVIDWEAVEKQKEENSKP